MTVIVPLTQGYQAIIDDEDAERVFTRRWTAQTSVKRHNAVYAKSRTLDGSIQLHRFIMNAPTGMDVDHINGNGLDNRRINLRVATRSQNLSNIKTRRGKFGYLGVHQNVGGKFRAEVCRNYKTHRVSGSFYTAEEAALARDELAIRLFGEFASLNFEEHRQTLLSAQRLEENSAKSSAQIPGYVLPGTNLNATCQKPELTSVPLSVTTAIGQPQ
jgi:hypothetical protein